MKIIYIVPGFGGTFYCGNCVRDNTISAELIRNGHEPIVLPMYLPQSSEDFSGPQMTTVFYGAVNIYLKQKIRFLHKMPEWLYDLFNSPQVLKYAARKSGSTRAEGLGEMTISMLKGQEGYQSGELDRLIDYLGHIENPDIVHLSNALLMGVASRIRKELKIPVVCSLQDEDVWVDAMTQDYRSRLWELMSEKSADIDIFVSVSNFFKEVMKEKMNIEDEKIAVIPLGVDPSLFTFHFPEQAPPAIGYLSRLNEENGLGILVKAFAILKEKPGFRESRLVLTGGMTGDDKHFIKKQMDFLKKKNMNDHVEIIDNFTPRSLGQFFDKISILTVPVLKGEAFGLYQLQAMASGIPVVQPHLGAFPEVIGMTGGGTTYSPNTPEVLAGKWAEVLSSKDILSNMSTNGRMNVMNKFSLKQSVEKLTGIYAGLLNTQ